MRQLPPLSHIAPVIGIILAVTWNIPHLVSVYADTIGVDANIYHYAMMVIIEFSVLVFALKKYEYAATTFAIIIFFLNLYFYFDFNQSPIRWEWDYLWFSFSRVLFSAIPAYLIAYYSQMFANTFTGAWKDDRERLEENRVELDKISKKLETVSNELEKDKEELAELRGKIASFKQLKGSVLRVDGVKSEICECDRLVIAGSNREGSRVCSCGKLIEW